MAKEFMQNDDGFFVVENGKIVASGERARKQYATFLAEEERKAAVARAKKQTAAEMLASLLPSETLEALVTKLKTEQGVEEGN